LDATSRNDFCGRENARLWHEGKRCLSNSRPISTIEKDAFPAEIAPSLDLAPLRLH
jgi:hypothetical protein